MSISSKELVDNLIVGNFINFSSSTMRLLEVIESGQELMLNDVALNDPDQLSVAIFNYPIIKDDLYKEFAEAAKRISSAKYAYYKKSATFKENFTKLCTETFNKHHQSDNASSHLEQIQRVRSALKVIKFIGELYLSDFFINCNVAHFLEVLSKNIESKISEDCLECFISIISSRVKNEVKLYKHNIHTAAIVKMITEYENDASKMKRNYNDLEIIEAVNKTIKKNSLKGSNGRKDSKSETIRQTRKIFETILSGIIPLSSCVQNAYDVSIIFPDSFENEMLQLCVDYIKKSFETPEESFKNKCLEIVKFIGMLYNFEALTSDGLKGTINFLNKLDTSFSEPLKNVLFNEIYDKVNELNDDVVKQIMPENFNKKDLGPKTTEILEAKIHEEDIENDDDENNNKKEDVSKMSKSIASSNSDSAASELPPKKHSTADSNNSLQICGISNYINSYEPVDKFKDLLIKLSPTNVAYILREISQIRFTISEDTVKELCGQLVEHSINKPALIKAIAQVSVKLPETIIPHFNSSLMKKHLKAQISTKISGCLEKQSNALGQLIKELHLLNYYDRFDIIISLDVFMDNFNHDRTVLPSLLQFIEELKDILIGKKMSKNIKQKLVNISQKLSALMNEEYDEELKEKISNCVKILNAEFKSEGTSTPKKDKSFKSNGDATFYRQESYDESGSSSPITLPPMHLPPPKMFIPPPNIIFAPENFPKLVSSNTSSTSSSNGSSICENSTYTRDISLAKEKNQMTFKVVVDTKSDEDSSNRQSGSPSSISLSMQEHDIESDEFYDTASDVNAEIIAYSNIKNYAESESVYSSLLMDDHSSKEETFKAIVRNQFLYDNESMDKFIVTFIKRGMKCLNSGFVNFIEVIQDALKDDKEIFKEFIAKMDQKFLEFIQNLPRADKTLSKSDKRKSLQLILMTGEFFNMGLMKNQTFISCLEKLLNDIGREHQIILFHELIKISMDKIIQNGITNVCKTFLDVLAKRVPSIVDLSDRNLITWELFVTIKVLLFRCQKFQTDCPVTFFKMFLSNLSEDTFMSKLKHIKFYYNYKKEQLAEVVEFFLLTAISSYQSPIYVKLAEELQGVIAVDDNKFTFKTHMEFKLHDVIKNFLDDVPNESKMTELFKITSFVGDLYAGNVASIYLVLCILEMLLEKEIENRKIVDCIKVLLQKVGFKTDVESVLILDKFFLFFKEVIKCDRGYRRIVYKELIDLRDNNWSRTENEIIMELIEEYFGKMTDSNFVQTSILISKVLSNSLELMDLFLKFLWKQIIINSDSTFLIAKLTNSISNYNDSFKSIFMTFMKQRNKTFKIICQEPKIPVDTNKKLSTVILFMGYLYTFGLCGDDDIGIWIHPAITKHLCIEQCNKLNSIIGTKINESQNNELLKAFLTLVEYHSRENLFAVINSVKSDLTELTKLNLKL